MSLVGFKARNHPQQPADDATEAEALGALQPGVYPIARGFGIEVREGPVKRFGDGGRS